MDKNETAVELLWMKQEYFLDEHMGKNVLETQWIVLFDSLVTDEQLEEIEKITEGLEDSNLYIVHYNNTEICFGCEEPYEIFIKTVEEKLDEQKKLVQAVLNKVGV